VLSHAENDKKTLHHRARKTTHRWFPFFDHGGVGCSDVEARGPNEAVGATPAGTPTADFCARSALLLCAPLDQGRRPAGVVGVSALRARGAPLFGPSGPHDRLLRLGMYACVCFT
jgi:hypothetical protein